MNTSQIKIRASSRRNRAVIAAAAAAAATAMLAISTATPTAGAATYRAAQCSEQYSAGHGDAVYARTSNHYAGVAACDGPGLMIRHLVGRNRTPSGRNGAWTIAAPAGATIIRAAARVAAAADGGHVPQVAMILPSGARHGLGDVRGTAHGVTWAGAAARAFSARLICAATIDCGAGREAAIDVRGIVLTLRDVIAPALGLAGELTGAGSRRGTESLEVAAGDGGGGVASVAVQVNGEPIAARTLRCGVGSSGVAVRVQPCPAESRIPFELDTSEPPFRQGQNSIRVCAADFAPAAGANRRCESRGVRVDNLCPVSAIGGTHLSARVERRGSAGDTRSTIVGRVLDTARRPLPGAKVCVATRVRMRGAIEKVAAVVRTAEDGRYSVRLPDGPTREVRVAHWPDPDHALEELLTVEAAARPRLDLSPDRVLRNGERINFSTRLPGPGEAGRNLVVQARSTAGWVPIAVGRTNSTGTWQGSYRFHATTRRQTYRFRVQIPHQPGYPYTRGHSDPKRVTVRG